MEVNGFEHWGILEIMGHVRFAGLIRERTIAGTGFVEIEVPAVEGRSAFSKVFGTNAVYCITPTTQEIARAAASEFRARPLTVLSFPVQESLPLKNAVDYIGAGDDDYEDES